MYKDKLPGEIGYMLKFEDEFSCMNEKYVKLPINNDVIGIYKNEGSSYFDLELVFLYSKNKNDIIICFDSRIANLYDCEDILFSKLKRKVSELVKSEFLSVSDLVEIDMDKDLTDDILKKAEHHYINDTHPQYVISYNKTNYTIEEIIKIGENIYDFAYEEMEKLLEKNPKELISLKEHLIISRLLNNSEDSFDDKVKTEKLFYELSKNENYKNLTFKLERTNGEIKSIKVSNFFSSYISYPIYAIQSISHGRSVLYEKGERNFEAYKRNKTYNLKFSGNEYGLYLSKEILKDSEFTKELIKENIYNFKFMSSDLKENKDYIKELILYVKKETHYSLLALFKELPEKLQKDKDIIFFFMNSEISIPEVYEHLNPELQEDEEVLEKYFSSNPKLSWIISGENSTWESILEKEVILKAFQKYIHENKKINLNKNFLKYIEDKDDALLFAGFTSDYGLYFNFSFFNKNLKEDMTFVKEYYKIVSLEGKYFVSFNAFYDFLTEKQKKDNDFLCDLISITQISKENYCKLPEEVKTDKFNLCMINRHKESLNNLSKEKQLEYLDSNPKDICFSFLATYDGSSSEGMSFLKKHIKKYPELLSYIKILKTNDLIELLHINIDCFEYGIKHMYSISMDLLNTVKDKLFVLDKIGMKSISSLLLSPDKIDFFKAQIKLPNYKFRYIAEIDKKGNYELINNRELITESVHYTGWDTLEYLPNNSSLKSDKEFAYDILQDNCNYLLWFKPVVRKNKEFLKELYMNYSTQKKADLLCILPKVTAKELLSLES